MSSTLFHSTSHLSNILKLRRIRRDRAGRESQRLRLRDLQVEQRLNRRGSSIWPRCWRRGPVRAVAVASGPVGGGSVRPGQCHGGAADLGQ